MEKRYRIVILTMIMLFVSVGTANAATGNSKVDWLIEEGYVKGDSNGYRLKDNITRAETTKMVVEAGGLGGDVLAYQDFFSMFSDINIEHWANGYVNVSVINQLVNGYPDGSFKPSNNVTYAEVIKMLVMANGDIPDTSSYSGSLWAVPYILKADEVGITDDVNIINHYEKATREKVFELVYNTMYKEELVISEEFKGVEEYNGIVVENERVSKLKDTQVSLIVLEDNNSSSNQTPRYKVNDKVTITLPKEVEDVEYLLGKVVDITIDSNNIATKIREDRSYSYLEGPILASEDLVYLGTNGEYYDVTIDDRSSSRINRILGVYHNDRNYDYDEYIDTLGDYDANRDLVFLAEYANITVKNGRTYFIDSYTFEDISPVSSTSRDTIYIYDDSNNASISKLSIDNVVGYTDGWGFESLDIRDIGKGDIVHIYNRDSALVRMDSKNYGQFNELIDESGYYFADIDGDFYQVRVSTNRMPVYSVDGKEFKTLNAEDPNYDIFDLLDKEIMYLLDINGHIQTIEG